VYYRGSQMLRH